MIKIPNIRGLATLGKAAVAAHRPEILFGTSLVSTVAAVVAAARGGYKSGQEVLLKEMGHEGEDPEDLKVQLLDVKEKIQLTWLNYLPAAGLTGAALGSTTGLHLVHVKEKKALAAAALMAIEEVKTEARTYIDDVQKAIQANTDEETAGKIIDDAVDPEKKGLALASTSDGEVKEFYLVRDPITGRDIWTNKAALEEAIVEVGNNINASDESSLNNFWEMAGWGRLPLGEELGWSGVIPAISWTDLHGQPISTVRDDGRPVRSFRFQPDPEKGFDNPHR